MHKGLTIDDIGVSRDTVFQEIRPGVGFETADFVKEKLGGGLCRRTTRTCRVEKPAKVGLQCLCNSPLILLYLRTEVLLRLRERRPSKSCSWGKILRSSC